eukprot:63407_1
METEQKTKQFPQLAPPSIAVYAIEQGIKLFKCQFSTQCELSEESISIGEQCTNSIFNEKFTTEFEHQFNQKETLINLPQHIEIIKEEIDILSTTIQD